MSGVSDPIADMLTRIRNAVQAQHLKVDIPSSKMKVGITKILKDEGFIKNYKIIDVNKLKVLRIYLKYPENSESAIMHLARISKPGRRVYIQAKDLKPVLNNIGVRIISTPKGLLTNKAAQRLNVGGEVICEIS